MMGLLILVLLIIVFYFASRLTSQKWKPLSISLIWKLLAAYFAILLIASGWYLLVVSKNTSPVEKSSKSVAHLQAEPLMEAASKGDIQKIHHWLTGQWSKNFAYHKLQIQTAGNNGSMQIVIEKSSDLNGKIHGYLYKTDTIVNGLSIPGKLLEGHVEWSGNTLNFAEPKTKLQFAIMNFAFPFNQWTKSNSNNQLNTASLGRELLYLQVPANVQIINQTGAKLFYAKKQP